MAKRKKLYRIRTEGFYKLRDFPVVSVFINGMMVLSDIQIKEAKYEKV